MCLAADRDVPVRIVLGDEALHRFRQTRDDRVPISYVIGPNQRNEKRRIEPVPVEG